jgi:hypothetical protein
MYLSILAPLQEVWACLDPWKSCFQRRDSPLSLESIIPTSQKIYHRRPLWSFLPSFAEAMLPTYTLPGRRPHALVLSLVDSCWVPTQRRMRKKWYQTQIFCYSTLSTLCIVSSYSQAWSCSSRILVHLGTALHNTCAPGRPNVRL